MFFHLLRLVLMFDLFFYRETVCSASLELHRDDLRLEVFNVVVCVRMRKSIATAGDYYLTYLRV